VAVRRLDRWLPWLGAAVLLAGLLSYGATQIFGGDESMQTLPGAAKERATQVDPVERRVALEFIRTAVARKHLDRAWDLAAPELKQGTTRAEWLAGTLPVVPYPVEKAQVVPHVVQSFSDRAVFDVTFFPHLRSGATPQSFRLDLRKVGGHWLVSAWQPSATIRPHKGK
jgi:hypothetical protein